MPPPDVCIRDLTVEDRAALESFDCRDFREPWTNEIEETIRERLVGSVASGDLTAIGLFTGDRLHGIAVWRIDRGDPPVCHSILVALQMGSYRKGYGRRLKEVVVERARCAGAAAVISVVHMKNERMLDLNARFGAAIEPDEADPRYRRCIIPLA
jgi:GNAT superfamily N-acetyltransferase